MKDGSFKEIVLAAVDGLKNGPTTFAVENEDVEMITLEPRKELTGKHIDTKIEFRVNVNKITIHVYNSRQKLLVQGSKSVQPSKISLYHIEQDYNTCVN